MSLNSTRIQPLTAAALIVLVVICGVLFLGYITPSGAGISPDSTIYLGVANQLVAGDGLVVPFSNAGPPIPLTHYPPLYPGALAGMALLTGSTTITAARVLNLALYIANLLLAALLTWRATHRAWTVLLATALLAFSYPILLIHAYAWSEPLFLFLGFTGLVLLDHGLDRRSPILLGLAGVAFALSSLTRYLGLAFILTGSVGVYLWRRRWLDAAIFAAFSAFPLGLWFLRNTIVAGSASNRSLAFHLINKQNLRTSAITILEWLSPFDVRIEWLLPLSLAILVLFSLIIMMMVVFVYRRQRRHQAEEPSISKDSMPSVVLLAGVFILTYLALVTLSLLFIDTATPYDNRILSPVYTLSVILLAWLVSRVSLLTVNERFRRLAPVLFALACLWIAGSQIWVNRLWLEASRTRGIDYNEISWKTSRLLQTVRSLPDDWPIFTNAPEAVYLYTGRRSLMLPFKYDPYSHLTNSEFQAELLTMQQTLVNEKGIILIFNRVTRSYLPAESELRGLIRMQLVAQESDGAIYQVPLTEPPPEHSSP